MDCDVLISSVSNKIVVVSASETRPYGVMVLSFINTHVSVQVIDPRFRSHHVLKR